MSNNNRNYKVLGNECNSFLNPTGLNFEAQPQLFAKLVRVGL